MARNPPAPEFGARRRPAEVAAVVAVEEAAVDENYRPVFRQYDIGSPRQATVVQSESVASCMESPANQEFRARVLRADRRHIPPSDFQHMNVTHQTTMPICCPASSDLRAKTCGFIAAAIA